MDSTLPTISLTSLLIAFAPSALLLVIMYRWSLRAQTALYANARMLIQLLAVGYVLTYVFETDEPALIAGVVTLMVVVAAWIALRPLRRRGISAYSRTLVAVSASGLTMLAIVTQLVLDLPRWFEPSFVVPLAGMIFANVALARRTALDRALIPQINGLLAVGLVSLPGMMTGQILSGVEPLVAVRYQIMVMCMVFGAGGLGATVYLAFAPRAAAPETT
jgi:putative ABC transport system permease protein